MKAVARKVLKDGHGRFIHPPLPSPRPDHEERLSDLASAILLRERTLAMNPPKAMAERAARHIMALRTELKLASYRAAHPELF